jgi:hypothetical protein
MVLGRVMKGSMRTRLQDTMAQLKAKYREALKDEAMQDAFDALWAMWSSEMGAMIYSEVLSTLDLLLLTAAADNRREIDEIKRRLSGGPSVES